MNALLCHYVVICNKHSENCVHCRICGVPSCKQILTINHSPFLLQSLDDSERIYDSNKYIKL